MSLKYRVWAYNVKLIELTKYLSAHPLSVDKSSQWVSLKQATSIDIMNINIHVYGHKASISGSF